MTSLVHLKEAVLAPFWKVTSAKDDFDCGTLNLLTSIKTAEQNRNKNTAKCKKLIPIK